MERNEKIQKLQEEYDKFGPWVLKIEEKSDIPPDFEGVVEIDNDVELAVKIPVNKERRNLRPGMNMYQNVLVLFKDHFQFAWKKRNRTFSRDIKYRDVKAIQNENRLLYGDLRIFLNGEIFSIEYNSVSASIIEECIRIIRKKYPVGEGNIELTGNIENSDIGLPVYKHLLQKIQTGDKTTIAAYQKDSTVKRLRKSLVDVLKGRSRFYKVQGGMILLANDEIIVADKSPNLLHESVADYSYRLTWFPAGDYNGTKREALNVFEDVKLFSILNENIEIGFYTTNDFNCILKP